MPNELEQSAHAVFGGSSYKRWKNCPGSITLLQTVPRKPSGPAAAKGTKAHNLAEYCLRHDITDAREVLAMDPQPRWEGAPFDDKAMAEAVNVYLDTIASLRKAYPKAKEWIEVKVYPTAKYADECYGSMDFGLYHIDTGTLKIIDYKNGQQPVDPEENDQELFYGAAVVREAEAKGFGISSVELIIVQPNVFAASPEDAVKRWLTTAERLRSVPLEIEQAIERCKEPDAPVIAGEWCTFCDAAAVCPANKNAVLESLGVDYADLLESDFNMFKVQPTEDLKPEDLARLLVSIKSIEAWCEAVSQLAYHTALSGKKVPGFKLVEKSGKRKWSDDELTISDTLQLLYGLEEDDVRPRKLATITEIESRLKRTLLDSDEFKAAKQYITLEFMTKESSGLKLVPESERGEAVSPLDAAATYADLLT